MSEGGFSVTKYEADSTNIYAGKLQPETLQMIIDGNVNDPPTGVVTPNLPQIRFTNSPNAIGVTPRNVRIRFTGVLPTGYLAGQFYYIPILTIAVFNAISIGDTGSYLGADIEVVGKTSERIR